MLSELKAQLQSARADIAQRDAGLAQCSEELGNLQCRITELDQVSKNSPALAAVVGLKLGCRVALCLPDQPRHVQHVCSSCQIITRVSYETVQ